MAALETGKNYKFRAEETETEYGNSCTLFKNFLTGTDLLEEAFDEDSAEDFYTSVRCGLVHEARTKNGWKIRACGEAAIDVKAKIVYRKQLQQAIGDYITNYGKRLAKDENVQKRFLRKFNHLCDLQTDTK